MPSSCSKAVRGSVRAAEKIVSASPNRKRSTSMWWIDMLRKVSRS